MVEIEGTLCRDTLCVAVLVLDDARHEGLGRVEQVADVAGERLVAAVDQADQAQLRQALVRHALYRALGAYADALPDDPDGPVRTRGQKMADCLLDLVLRPGEQNGPPVQARLTVVAGVATLLGGDQPGEIDGEPVPAEMVRALARALGLLAVGSLSAMQPIPASGEAALSADAAALMQDGNALLQEDEHGKKSGPRARPKDGVQVADGLVAAARDRALDVAKDADKKAGRTRRAPGDTIPTVEELVAMRTLGVNARYIDELRAAGYTGLSPEQLIEMRAVGVTASYAAELSQAGFGRLPADKLVSLRAVGVTAAYLAELRRYGYTGLSADAVTGA